MSKAPALLDWVTKVTKETKFYIDEDKEGNFKGISFWNGPRTAVYKISYDWKTIYREISKPVPTKLKPHDVEYAIDENGNIWPVSFINLIGNIALPEELGGRESQNILHRHLLATALEFSCNTYFQYQEVTFEKSKKSGYLPEKSLDCIDSTTLSFVLRKGYSPSRALKEIFETKEPLYFDCNLAIQIITLMALCRTAEEIGRIEEFEKLFEQLSFEGQKKQSDQTLVQRLIATQPIVFSTNDEFLSLIQPGTICFVRNIPTYLVRHSRSGANAQGFNLIYLGKNEDGKATFAGLFNEKGIKTYEEIVMMLIQEYNAEPIKPLPRLKIEPFKEEHGKATFKISINACASKEFQEHIRDYFNTLQELGITMRETDDPAIILLEGPKVRLNLALKTFENSLKNELER